MGAMTTGVRPMYLQRRTGIWTVSAILTVSLIGSSAAWAIHVGDLVRVKGAEQSKLMGMGLVVGLNRTGDGGKFLPAMKPLARVIRHFIDERTIASDLKDAKNVAIVMIDAMTPAAGVREGDRIDVHVSTLGSAKSIQGGRLMLMPMTGPLPNSPVYAYASGPVTIEDDDIPTTGVIHGGATLVADIRSQFMDDRGQITLVLKNANATFQTAALIASTINAELNPNGPQVAMAVDQKNVVVHIPESERANATPYIAEILRTNLSVGFIETGSRVRINEKTGTIVMTGDVEISPVAIMHGGLTITMDSPESQAPLAEKQNTVGIDTNRRGGAKLASLITAFNQLKVSIDDRIAIIKEIHRTGKLHADLVFE